MARELLLWSITGIIFKWRKLKLKIRKLIELEFAKVFKDYNLIIGPTTTTLPYEIGI